MEWLGVYVIVAITPVGDLVPPPLWMYHYFNTNSH